MREVDPSLVEVILSAIRVRAWRLHLETPGVMATVPMLRGVWGAALHAVSEAVYHRLFEGGENQVPRYVLRPAAREVRPSPAVEFLLFGELTHEELDTAWAAWDRAAEMGLGPNRIPFRMRKTVPLAWDETALHPARVQPGFTLAHLPWPLDPQAPACRLDFAAPLRLIHRKQLVSRPAPADLVIAVLRRMQALAAEDPRTQTLWESRREWLDVARSIPHLRWEGRRLDLLRFSSSQQAELELRGVSGSLILPDGPGPLSPLLNAATWLHLGKGTVMGLGQVWIMPHRVT
jgi:hypothetical protein